MALSGADCIDLPPINGGGSEVTLELSPSRQVLAMIDEDGFANLLDLSSKESTRVLQPLVTQYVSLFAAHFGGDIDFVMFTLDAHRERLRFTPVGGFNITVRMPESGLGSFVSIPAFASLPNLRSYIYLARKDSLVLGPALHELAHGWGVRFEVPAALGDQARMSDNHWGYSSVGGQMGGWMPGTLVDLGDGQFRLSRGNVETGGRSFNTVPYSPLERYMLGLIEAEAVPPIEVAVNPVFRSLFEFSAESIVGITIEDIVAANGLRRPTPSQAQRHFKVALIVLTDHSPTEEEWRFYQDSIDYFAVDQPADIREAFPDSRYAGTPIADLIAQPDPEDAARENLNFFEATEGLATLEFVALQSSTDGLNSGGSVTLMLPQRNTADLQHEATRCITGPGGH